MNNFIFVSHFYDKEICFYCPKKGKDFKKKLKTFYRSKLNYDEF